MTHERPPPARPWHELVIKEIALRGWTKAELSERSGVARTTIDNWYNNRRKPSAKAVNAVADVLGIERTRAHVVAGIVEPAAGNSLLPPELKGLHDHIHQLFPEDVASRVEENIAAVLRGETPPAKRNGGAGTAAEAG